MLPNQSINQSINHILLNKSVDTLLHCCHVLSGIDLFTNIMLPNESINQSINQILLNISVDTLLHR